MAGTLRSLGTTSMVGTSVCFSNRCGRLAQTPPNPTFALLSGEVFDLTQECLNQLFLFPKAHIPASYISGLRDEEHFPINKKHTINSKIIFGLHVHRV